MAATIGIRLPVHEPVGNMIIDIGGGTSDIAVVSLNGIVRSKNCTRSGETNLTQILYFIYEMNLRF